MTGRHSLHIQFIPDKATDEQLHGLLRYISDYIKKEFKIPHELIIELPTPEKKRDMAKYLGLEYNPLIRRCPCGNASYMLFYTQDNITSTHINTNTVTTICKECHSRNIIYAEVEDKYSQLTIELPENAVIPY